MPLESTLDRLAELLRHASRHVRLEALRLTVLLPGPLEHGPLFRGCHHGLLDPAARLRREAARALAWIDRGGYFPPPATRQLLAGACGDTAGPVRAAAVRALSRLPEPQALLAAPLTCLLADPSARVRAAAARAIARQGRRLRCRPERGALTSALVAALDDVNHRVGAAAASALAALGDELSPAVGRAVALLADASAGVRRSALRALRRAPSRLVRAAPTLRQVVRLFDDPDPGVRREAVVTAGRCGPLRQPRPAASPPSPVPAVTLQEVESFVSWVGIAALSEPAKENPASARGGRTRRRKALAAPLAAELVAGLDRALADDVLPVVTAAVVAVGRLGPGDQMPGADRFVSLLGHPAPPVREAVLVAARRVGVSFLPGRFFEGLVDLAAAIDEVPLGRRADPPGVLARRLLWEMVRVCPQAATPGLVGRLFGQLDDRPATAGVERDGREQFQPLAAILLACLRLPDGSGPLLAWLLDRLERPAEFPPSARDREASALALGCLGRPAHTPQALDALVGALADPCERLRACAAWALGQMGPYAATEAVFESLTSLLCRDTGSVVTWLAAAVGRLGPSAWRRVLASLARRLGGADRAARNQAVRAAHALRGCPGLTAGPAFADFLDPLLRLLSHPSASTREAACNAAEGLGRSACSPQLHEALTLLADDEDLGVRLAARSALDGLGP
jgi:HEAT repeat protein